MSRNRNFRFNRNHRDKLTANNIKQRKRDKHKKSSNPKNLRGYWEASFWQKIVDRISESLIKEHLGVKGNFDVTKIDKLMDEEYISVIDRILEKQNNEKKLTKKEKTILNVHNTRKKKRESKDNKNLDKEGLACSVITNSGVIKKLLLALEKAITEEKYDLVYFIYLQFNKKRFNLTEDIKKENKELLSTVKEIIDNLDIISLQFNKYYHQMPPLDIRTFQDLEPFQKIAINAMRNNESFIISAPTSAGKSIITSYLASMKKIGKLLIVVPTSALAWQMSAIFSAIIKDDVPLITRRFKSYSTFNELKELVIKSKIVVGTPSEIFDLLPIVWDHWKTHLSYVIFDEIHLMGEKNEYKTNDMENLAKIFNYSDIQFGALSATIGNMDELHKWWCRVSNNSKKIIRIRCDNRFFNLQRFLIDSKGMINNIHPLSMVEINDFIDRSILDKDLFPVPNQIWELYEKLIDNKFKLGNIDAYKYFKKDQHITLKDSYKWFNKLLEFMIDNINNKIIISIIESYKIKDIKQSNVELIDILFQLKKHKKTPALIFYDTTESVLEEARKLIYSLKKKELDENKDLEKEREKLRAKDKKDKKKEDKEKSSRGNFDHDFDKKKMKENMKDEKLRESVDINKTSDKNVDEVRISGPLKDYIFLKHLELEEGEIKVISDKLKPFGFKMNGNDYHYLIEGLWRGIGIYCTGMPDNYLRIVQKMACNRKLAVILSDNELAFGISIPILTTLQIRDQDSEEEINVATAVQRSGRAGRRGQEPEGFVGFEGFKKEEIQQIMKNSIPDIGKVDTRFYSLEHLILLTGDESLRRLTSNNFNGISDERSLTFYENIRKNLFGNDEEEGPWSFAIMTKKNDDFKFDTNKDVNKKMKEAYESHALHFNHLMHKLRSLNNELDWVRLAYIIKYINKIFREVDVRLESNQVLLSQFLLHFLSTEEYNGEDKELPNMALLNEDEYSAIKENLEDLGVGVPDKKDGCLFFIIQMNKLEDIKNPNGTMNKIKTYLSRKKLLDFIELLIIIQNYYYLIKEVNIARLFAKLFTRTKWIYQNSNPIMKPIKNNFVRIKHYIPTTEAAPSSVNIEI